MMDYKIFPDDDDKPAGQKVLFIIEVALPYSSNLARALAETQSRTDQARLVSLVKIIDDESNRGGTLRRFVATYA